LPGSGGERCRHRASRAGLGHFSTPCHSNLDVHANAYTHTHVDAPFPFASSCHFDIYPDAYFYTRRHVYRHADVDPGRNNAIGHGVLDAVDAITDPITFADAFTIGGGNTFRHTQ
jgi:hypothetical protein